MTIKEIIYIQTMILLLIGMIAFFTLKTEQERQNDVLSSLCFEHLTIGEKKILYGASQIPAEFVIKCVKDLELPE